MPWLVRNVRGVSQPYVETASVALRIDWLVDLSDALNTRALQPRVCASVRRTATFVHAPNPWAHFQDFCSDPMPSCIKLIIVPGRGSLRIYRRQPVQRGGGSGCVTMNVLWPEPLCETWEGSLLAPLATLISAARLTWSKSFIKTHYSQARNLASLVCSRATIQRVLPTHLHTSTMMPTHSA